ncbi:MAG: dTDP-glucose 4,6-dehydratase [Gammaproteobacteria bacterium]|nr:dTDP-glucose 4,6-dehydratase [Gammaproteobacteria bacterium]
MRILITGGAGFIGSALVRHLIQATDHRVMVVDKLTYSGSLTTLDPVIGSARLTFQLLDICDAPGFARCLGVFQPDAVMHLAAESHVDRSVDGPAAFVRTNIEGTFNLMDQIRQWWTNLDAERAASFRFLHVSTDEVFGSLGAEGVFTEDTPYAPRSPYSASKAASDHLVQAWHHTFGIPVLTTNCSNNYGPYQFPEKLVPLMITRALGQQPLPVYGSGDNIRDWLHVEDHVRGLLTVLERGIPGERYVLGGRCERRNIDVVENLCAALDRLAPRSDGSRHADAIAFVTDRPGHDARYAVDCSRAERELGWRPRWQFDAGMEATVSWYLENAHWLRSIEGARHASQRLGLASTRRQAS